MNKKVDDKKELENKEIKKKEKPLMQKHKIRWEISFPLK